MTQHVLTILIEDEDVPDSDEDLETFLVLFESFWDKVRDFNRSSRGITATRFRSAGLV